MTDTQLLRDILAELKKMNQKLEEVKNAVGNLESTVLFKD